MSTTIDEKVVEMKFDNSDFEKNVKTSMSTLESLKNSLNFSGASKGLEDFSDDVGTVSKSFSALEVMAVAALVNITNSAIDAGKQLVESLTIDQVAAGWEKYAEKTQAVQTIMAATGLSIDEVNEQLEKLNWFTDETSYNFTDMTNNIGKFTSQGVELESAVTAMEGISTWAALSGGNVEEASRAMYNLSQAMGVGAVKLQDWKSIENANMATKEFKETAIESALSLGTLTKSADGTITTLKDTEVTVANFSSTLSDCWFSSDVLIDTLNKYGSFADALNVACEKTNLTASELLVYLSDYKNGTLDLAEVQKETALSASELTSMFEGLSDETFTLGDKAFRAAQEAKTFKEAVDSVKDAVSTGWMTTFEIIFGNYEQAKELWTDLANAMYDAFAESGNTRNELLKEALGEESAMLSVSEEAWSNYAKTNKESLSVFEDALIKTAREHGIAIDDMIEQEGSFAATLKHGWLTDNIITEALSNLTTSVETATTSLEEIEEVATRVIRGEFGNGADRIKALTEAGYDYATVQSYVNHVLLGTEFQFEELSDAQLENMGYTEEQIETLRELAKQAEETGTPLNELIESLNRPSGRDNLVQSFWNTWEAVSKLIGSIKGAWDEIFPAATADQIYNFTVALEEFTSHLIISDETADTLKRTFKGLFAILDIGYQAISALAGGFKNLISFILPAGNGILGVTGSIGDFFVAVDEAVKSSEIFSKTIQAIGKVLEPVAVKARSFITLMLEGIANAINWANENNVLGNVINNFGNILSAVAEIVRNWIKAFASLPAVQSAITKFSTAASNTLSNLRSYFSGGMEQIAAFVERVKAMDSLSLDNFKVMLKDFKDNVLGYFLNIDGVFDDFTKLLGDFRDSVVSRMKEIRDNFSFDSVKDILGSFSDFLKEKFDGIGENLSGFKKIVFDVFGAVKDFLAENIGAIIAILTGAGIIVAVKKLKDVLEAVTSPIQAFTGLIESLSGTLGAYSKKLKSEALLKIAEAIAVLAASLWIISTIDSDRLLSSVAVLAGVMVSLLGVAKASEKIKITDFGKIGSMMLSLGASLLLISLAMKNMGGMDGAAIEQSIEVIGKLGILFAAMIAVSKFSGSSANKVGTMLLKASVGLLIIAQAMKSIAKMDTADVKKSIEAIGMLELMFVALVAVSKLSGSSADKAGTMLLKASAGLLIIAQAMKSIAKMDKTDIQKSIEAIGMLELMFAALIAVSKLSGADASKAGSMLLKASAGILVLAIAMKSIAKMDKTDIQKSIEAIGMLELMFAALIAVSKLGGKNASGAGTMLLEMSAAILVLAVAMGVFSLLDPADIAIGIAAVTALETMFAVLIAVTKNAKDCKSTMLVIAATIGILAIAVAALTLIDPAKLATATLALDSLMGMFALMVASTSVAKKANLTLIVMTAVVGGLAVILSLLANNTNVDSALVCAGALSLLLLSLSASMLILSNARTISASAYTALITMTGITALLAAIIGVLASFDVGPTLEIAESLSLLLLSLSGACLILSAVGLTGAAAFAGVGALATLIVAVGSLMAAIGALMTYVPSMEEFLDKGMAALEKVGYGLGAFFGNIIGGFAAGVTAGLPDIGSNLSGFMENAQVFFNGIQNIDDGALTGVKNLVETILLLSAGELMSSVTSWLTGGDSMTTFAEQLVPFGEAMVSFSNTIADLDADVVTNAATAGQALAEMASTIPNSGGVVSFFTGENDMEAFGAQLVPFGEAMKSFEEVISGIDAEVITNAATAGKALTEMGSTVPNSGGVVGWFCGENDMGKFGEQLIPFGEAMKEFGDVVDGLSADAIVNAATAGSAVVELANTLPNTGGLVSWFTGDNDIGAFGESLVIFGENFAQYADYMKTVDRCSKCGRLTPYNLRGKCTQDRCTGTLSEVNPDEVLSTNFYRNQYKEKKIESIVIQEHTAQLERKQAKEYQIDFKNKKINILSCSTTFEMGIDIGGLETVFMRNVPPTPANYVQRAGRAGRRKDSAAYILTYCGTGSHDYTYFSEPEKMISGVINPPCFNVLNKKIIVRHLMATSLGYFFRLNPELFKSLDALVINGGTEVFKQYMLSHPADLNEYINKKIIPETQYDEYRDFKWIDEMGGEDEKMAHFVETILEMIREYEKAKEKAVKEDRGSDSDYYKKQIESLKKQDVLESLSKYCVIPKYGFPVDVVDLQVYENGMPINKFAMSRDLKIAISEYAPDSEVIVDKKKYTSKYITFKKNAEFTKNWFVTCPTCRKMNVFLSKSDNTKCKYCGQDIGTEVAEYYIEPINGFKSGETKESTRLKPKRSYAGEVTYVGGGKKDGKRLVIGNTIYVETSSDDELLVMNKSGFYMCPTCGYSDIVKHGPKTPQTLKTHKNFKQYNCSNDTLEYIRLGHKFETDVARFTIPMLDSVDKVSFPQALSFLYAFLEGVSIALGIERTDIDGILELNLDIQSYDILLYDNVPGGAGHVKRLLSKEAIVSSLKAGLDKVSKECCDENTSCYNCLRNYYNQSYHNKLVRKLAMDIIKKLLFEIDGVTESFQNERWHWNSQVSD